MVKKLKVNYRNLPLARKISLLSIAVIFLVMILFTLIIQHFFEESVIELAGDGYIQKFEAVSKNCMTLFSDAERLSKVLCTDEDIQSWFICDKEENNAEYVRKTIQVERSLDYLDALYPDNQFSSISIFNQKGDMVNTNNIRNQKTVYSLFFQEIAKEPAAARWLELYDLKVNGYDKGGIAYIRPYKDYMTGKVQGYIMVEYDTKVLIENFEQLRYGSQGTYLIAGLDGKVKIEPEIIRTDNIRTMDFFQTIVDTENNNTDATLKLDGIKYLVTSSKIDTLNWFMIGMTPVNSLTEEGKVMVGFFYLIGLLAMVISCLLNSVMAHSVTKPITNLADRMGRFGKGELTVSVPVDSEDETGMLSKEFNKMTEKIQLLINQVYTEQTEKRKSEIDALQAQINPHFLYNTLNSVCSLIKVEEPQKAYDMVYDIGQFYRSALSNGRVIITIEEELVNVKSYIKIQTIRYGTKISYDIKIEDSILPNCIVKLTLQPLVENAVYHGIKEMKGQGSIEILGFRQGDNIYFKVKDNGIGMEQEKANALLKQDSKHLQTSFGLYSIHQRIQLYFGKEYGLTLQSSLGKGTCATVCIPCIEQQEG